jgi:formate C-acetyltransferase
MPLADSLSAMQGRAREGITAILNTVNKLDLSKSIGAAVVNLHFQEDLLKTADDRKKFINLMNSHFKNGGFEVQVSVSSLKELLSAQKEPEKHRDLMVRVGGYAAYFTQLDKLVQDTIIDRIKK